MNGESREKLREALGERAAGIPPHHLAQIRVLDRDEGERLRELVDGLGWGASGCGCIDPERFASTRQGHYDPTRDDALDERSVRKWLYRCGVPFRERVLVLPDDLPPIETTWKIVVRYWEGLLGDEDAAVVHPGGIWLLGACHHQILSFGTRAAAS